MFRAMVAYFVGAWLLLQIANVTFPPLGLPDWMQRALIIALAIGVMPAFAVAWIFDLTVRGVVRTNAAELDAAESSAGAARKSATAPTATHDRQSAVTAAQRASVGGANAGAATPTSTPPAIAAARATASEDASIAILPFADLSPEKDQDWFCDGLAEEIIDALCCVRDSERAIDLLERACEFGSGSRDWFEHDHDLDTLLHNPRFQALFARLAKDEQTG